MQAFSGIGVHPRARWRKKKDHDFAITAFHVVQQAIGEELTGRLKLKGKTWWAYSDEPSLAAPGTSRSDALANLLKMLDLYEETLEKIGGLDRSDEQNEMGFILKRTIS